jgi:hypothetical protein
VMRPPTLLWQHSGPWRTIRDRSERNAQCAALFGQCLLQDYGLIVHGIARSVQKGNPAFGSLRLERFELRAVFAQLTPVSLAKAFPPRGIVTEPFAQLGRWRELLHPKIERCRLLGHAAWPEAVDEHPHAIRLVWRIINALD